MPTNKQQRETARRQLQRQLAARQAAEARRRKALVVITAIGVVVVLGVVLGLVIGLSGNDKTTDASAKPSASATATAATTGPCAYQPSASAATNPDLKDVGLPPDPAPTPTIARTMTFTTNLGVIVATMDGAGAPCNVQSLAYLAQKGFYDNTPCPRAVDSGIFVVQCGDPSGTGSGGPTYTTKDENLAAADYKPGAIAMANGGANTNSSQFFFITADSNSGLQKNYTVVGQVTQGLDILQSVVAAGNDGSNQAGGGKPTKALKIGRAHV